MLLFNLEGLHSGYEPLFMWKIPWSVRESPEDGLRGVLSMGNTVPQAIQEFRRKAPIS